MNLFPLLALVVPMLKTGPIEIMTNATFRHLFALSGQTYTLAPAKNNGTFYEWKFDDSICAQIYDKTPTIFHFCQKQGIYLEGINLKVPAKISGRFTIEIDLKSTTVIIFNLIQMDTSIENLNCTKGLECLLCDNETLYHLTATGLQETSCDQSLGEENTTFFFSSSRNTVIAVLKLDPKEEPVTCNNLSLSIYCGLVTCLVVSIIVFTMRKYLLMKQR